MKTLYLFSDYRYAHLWQKEWMDRNLFTKARKGYIELPNGDGLYFIAIEHNGDRSKLRGITFDAFHNLGTVMNDAFVAALNDDLPFIMRKSK